MKINYRRGLWRLYIVSCFAWLAYLTIVLPVKRANYWEGKANDARTRAYAFKNTDFSERGVKEHAAMQSRLFEIAESLRVSGKISSYYSEAFSEWWIIPLFAVLPMVLVGVLGWALLCVSEWLFRGFARSDQGVVGAG